MKIIISKLLFSASILLGSTLIILPLHSCDNELKAEDAKESTTYELNRNTKFLIAAAEISLEEIEFGKLAQTNSFMDPIQELGKMMESEHTKAMQDLKLLAAKKGIVIPTGLNSDEKDTWKKLSNKSGTAFDKEYCDMMIKGHNSAISKFEKASAEITDPDIQSWAESMLPVLHVHLNHAISCKNACEKNM